MTHYVYEHWRPDTGQPFYVGKGKGYRAKEFRRRHAAHKAVVDDLSTQGLAVEIKYVATGLTEEDAYKLEIERIAFWKVQGVMLVNLTSGGNGQIDPSEETRAKWRLARAQQVIQHAPETRAKLKASNIARWADPELRARSSENAKTGWLKTPERPLSEQGRKNISEAGKRQVHTHEQNAARSTKLKDRVFSAETIAKMSAAKKGKKQSPEHVAARSAGLKGHAVSAETRARIGVSNRGRVFSAVAREKIRNAVRALDKNRTRNALGQYV